MLHFQKENNYIKNYAYLSRFISRNKRILVWSPIILCTCIYGHKVITLKTLNLSSIPPFMQVYLGLWVDIQHFHSLHTFLAWKTAFKLMTTDMNKIWNMSGWQGSKRKQAAQHQWGSRSKRNGIQCSFFLCLIKVCWEIQHRHWN